MSYQQQQPPPYPSADTAQQGYPQQPPYAPAGTGAGWDNTQSQSQGGGQPFIPPPPPRFDPTAAGMAYSRDDPEAPKFEFGFDDQTIRKGFIRKVFFILFIELATVCAMVGAMIASKGVRQWMTSGHSSTPLILYIAAYVIFIVVYIVLICCEGLRRKSPTNLIMAAILTLAIGYMTAMITAFHKTEIVLLTAIICVVCCGGIIIFAMQTKYDLTGLTMIMCALGFGLFMFGILAIFVMFVFHSKIMYLIYAGLAALFFMVFLAIDVQMIMGGKRYEISPEEYVFASIMLFLDIIYIFWMLLSLIGGSRS